MHAFPPAWDDPLNVEGSVDIVDAGNTAATCVRPRLAKGEEVFAAALRARPVPGSQCRRLVQKEQLGEPARAHQFPPPTLEFEPAGDPPADLPCADQLAAVVVKHTSVAEEESPRFGGDDVPERCDPVASRHGAHMVRADPDRRGPAKHYRGGPGWCRLIQE